jgi:hypothetical protein
MTIEDEVLVEEFRDLILIGRLDQTGDFFGAWRERHGERPSVIEPGGGIDRVVHGHELDVQALTG